MSLAPDTLTDANLAQAIEFHSVVDYVGALDDVEPPVTRASAGGPTGNGESLADVREIVQCAHGDTIESLSQMSTQARVTLA